MSAEKKEARKKEPGRGYGLVFGDSARNGLSFLFLGRLPQTFRSGLLGAQLSGAPALAAGD